MAGTVDALEAGLRHGDAPGPVPRSRPEWDGDDVRARSRASVIDWIAGAGAKRSRWGTQATLTHLGVVATTAVVLAVCAQGGGMDVDLMHGPAHRRVMGAASPTPGAKKKDSWWVYLLIPIVSGLVGWFTNWLAIVMTFYPIEFSPWKVWQVDGSPFGLFGWQGIIPAKAVKMTTKLTVLCRDKLIDMKEVFARLDPVKMAELMLPKMRVATRRALEESLSQEMPALWGSLPGAVKEEIAQFAGKDAAHFVRMLIEEIGGRLYDVFDILNLTVTKTRANKQIVVHMFQEVGKKEFRFLIHSGLFFGALLGVPQAVVYLYYKGNWVLPVAGFLVGYLTNWIALVLIFNPVRPVRLLGGRVVLQGVFLARQREAAAKLAELSAFYFFKPQDVWAEILNGAFRENMDRLLEEVTERFIARHVVGRVGGTAAAWVLGRDALRRVQEHAAHVAREELPAILPLGYDYMEQAMGAEETLRISLQNLPPEEFEGVLHPVFKEDEIKLILVGGVLGAVAGALQVLLFIHVAF